MLLISRRGCGCAEWVNEKKPSVIFSHTVGEEGAAVTGIGASTGAGTTGGTAGVEGSGATGGRVFAATAGGVAGGGGGATAGAGRMLLRVSRDT